MEELEPQHPILKAGLPLYRLLKSLNMIKPVPFSLTDIYASSMRKEYNWLFKLLIPSFFSHVTFHLPRHCDPAILASTHNIIYVGRNLGTLEYLYYNHLFLTLGFPTAEFANDISIRRWMKWKDLTTTLLSQLSELDDLGKILDPIDRHLIESLIKDEKSIFISLSSQELSDEELFPDRGERLLKAIIEASKGLKRPTLIIPLDFVWDKRQGYNPTSLFNTLFGERENPGKIRKTVLFWRHKRRRALAIVGDPIELNEEKPSKLREILLEKIKIERSLFVGPPIRPKSWFIKQVLADEGVENEIVKLAIERNKETDHMRSLAKRYINEIAADINYTFIEVAGKIMGWIFQNLYEGLKIDSEGLPQLKHLSASSSLVLVPNHKSHMDYLLLSYILHKNEITIPYVAAGLNLSFWPLGSIFRRAGGYFLRRSFNGNPLYRRVFEAYLQTLVKAGYTQEFFIEGGRSRTGSLMPPKLGMLSMLCNAAKEVKKERITFLPVTFSYDRVIEEAKYVEERKGSEKIREKSHHLLRLVRYLKKQKHKYGSIYINFGKPIDVNPNDIEIKGLAFEINRAINSKVVVTPSALAGAALLSTKEKGININEVKKTALLLLNWLSKEKVTLAQRLTWDSENAIDDALVQFSNNHLTQLHNDSILPFFEIASHKRTNIDFYKNAILHYISIPSLIANLMLSQGADNQQRIIGYFTQIYPLLEHEFYNKPNVEDIEKTLAWCKENLKTREEIKSISQQVKGCLESYYIALSLIENDKPQGICENDLIRAFLKKANEMLILGTIHCNETISKQRYQITLQSVLNNALLDDHSKEMGSAGRRIYSVKNIDRTSKLKDLLHDLLKAQNQ